MAYWERLNEIIQREPVDERDRFFVAMLRPLGIEKGKPFHPDARQKKILEDAAVTGELMARVNSFDKRFPGAYYRHDAHWKYVLTLDPKVERRLIDGITRPLETPGGLDGAFLRGLVDGISGDVKRASEKPGRPEPVLVVQVQVRAKLAELLRQTLPRLAVLSYAEIGGARRVESAGLVRLAEVTT
jgi:hypothetical protein